jgi:glutaminyl-peptide cyclotransferase
MTHAPLLLLAAAALLLSAAGCRPAPTGTPPARRAAFPVFSAENGTNALARAAALLDAAPSRDAGSPGAMAAAGWIAGQLREMGIRCAIDVFRDAAPGGETTFRNVVAEIPSPTTNLPPVLLLSHFDTKSGIPGFTGANDGASSTALLLEIASVAAAGGDLGFPLQLAFLDGEECRVEYGPQDGLHGSRRLAALARKSGVDYRAVVVLDMVGDRDLDAMIPANGDPGLARLLLAAANECGLGEYVRPGEFAILDDHQPFLDAGYPAIDLIDFHYGSQPGLNDYWHTDEDTLDKLSATSFEIVGRVVFAFLRLLGERPGGR